MKDHKKIIQIFEDQINKLKNQEKLLYYLLFINRNLKIQELVNRPPKGVLMQGPSGTGKTMMARTCAAQTKATFLKLTRPQLVQIFIGDGAKMVRDAFQLAQEKSPAIIFIHELDAIGTKRYDSDKNGD